MSGMDAERQRRTRHKEGSMSEIDETRAQMATLRLHAMELPKRFRTTGFFAGDLGWTWKGGRVQICRHTHAVWDGATKYEIHAVSSLLWSLGRKFEAVVGMSGRHVADTPTAALRAALDADVASHNEELSRAQAWVARAEKELAAAESSRKHWLRAIEATESGAPTKWSLL